MATLNVDAGVTRVVQSPCCASTWPVAASATTVQIGWASEVAAARRPAAKVNSARRQGFK